MKKILFLALAVSFLAFAGCNKNDKDDPTETYELTGELRGVMFPTMNPAQQAVITLHTKTNTVDVKFIKAKISAADETPTDVYVKGLPMGKYKIADITVADGSPYKPFPKADIFTEIRNGFFNLHFEDPVPDETQVYLVYNAPFKK